MSIVLNSLVDDERSGQNRVEVGRGTVPSAGVCLQGFWMSWGNSDHHLNVLAANALTPRISNENGSAFVTYDFRCELKDSSGNVTGHNRLRTVLIANYLK